jgi:hypothetical protein
LIKILKQEKYPIESFENLVASANELMTFNIEKIPLASLLFQTGYATIKSYDPESQNYSLEMPNYEVKDSLLKMYFSSDDSTRRININSELAGLRKALEADDLDTFIDKMKNFM